MICLVSMLQSASVSVDDYSSSEEEKSCVSRKWAITTAAEEDDGSISEISSIVMCLRRTRCRLPRLEYNRCRASTSSSATRSIQNDWVFFRTG